MPSSPRPNWPHSCLRGGVWPVHWEAEVAVPCGGMYGLVTENAQEMSVGKVLGDFKTLYHSFLSV